MLLSSQFVWQNSPDIALDALVEMFQALSPAKKSEAVRTLSYLESIPSQQPPDTQNDGWNIFSLDNS